MRIGISGERFPDCGAMRALVYGSCVSRDMVEVVRDSVSCVDYIARQSWISASTPALSEVSSIVLDSKFQQRMVEGDLLSNALPRIEEGKKDADLIVLDLVDERFGVYPVGDGFVTPTAEFHSSGLRDSLDLGPHLEFGSDAHFKLWSEASRNVRDWLGPLIGQTVVLSAPFTDVSTDGTPVPASMGRSAEVWNELYRRYYDDLEIVGYKVLRLPRELAVTTSHHNWGIAPFHYVQYAYAWWYEQLSRSFAA